MFITEHLAEFMPERLSYPDSYVVLQKKKLMPVGAAPEMRFASPRHDDATTGGGVRFIQAMVADVKLERLTLPRTFFGRSEFRAVSFKGTEFSESTANWNDFIQVNFSGADLSRSDFRGCLFDRVKFTGANLSGVDFRYCGFKQCHFTDADLTDAKLTQKAGAALKLSPEQQGVIDWQAEDGEEPQG